MSEVIDLDKARAARREAVKESPRVSFGGHEFVLPVELPYACLEAMRGMGEDRKTPGAIVGFMEALLGDQYDEFKDLDLGDGERPSMEDATEFVAEVMSAYGSKRPLA